jgi:hypothetical protein
VTQPVRYGHHVRAVRDTRPTFLTDSEQGVAALSLSVPTEHAGATVRSIRVEATEPRAGVSVRGVSILP